MFKPATLTLLIGALGLSSACIITNNGDDGGTTNASSDPTTQGDTGQTSDPNTSGGDESTDGADETTVGGDETSDPSDDTADETGGTPTGCGWGQTGDSEVPEGYTCGGEGEDPDGMFDSTCPEGLVEDGECGDLGGEGCCDADGNAWFCWDDGTGNQSLVKQECG